MEKGTQFLYFAIKDTKIFDGSKMMAQCNT